MSLFHIALFEPEIPPNTGNIIRLCANTGAQLHLIHPLGFKLTDKDLKRAGLDYHEWASVKEHANFSDFLKQCLPSRLFCCSTKGKNRHTDILFQAGDILLFGPESRGLPPEILTQCDSQHILRIPMKKGSRSLNLSNAVAVVLYEALRQQDFSEDFV